MRKLLNPMNTVFTFLVLIALGIAFFRDPETGGRMLLLSGLCYLGISLWIRFWKYVLNLLVNNKPPKDPS